MSGFPLQIDAENKTLIADVLLPGAHAMGLSQSDVTMAADFIVKPMTAERCEQTLRNIWRDDYEQGVHDFRAAMGAMPLSLRDLLTERFEEQLGSNPALIASIVSAFRRRQLRSR